MWAEMQQEPNITQRNKPFPEHHGVYNIELGKHAVWCNPEPDT